MKTSKNTVASLVLLLFVILATAFTTGCNKNPDSGTPTDRLTHKYSGTLYTYYRRYATGSNQVLIDSTVKPTTALLVYGRDSLTIHVDSMTMQKEYVVPNVVPAIHTVLPCCHPSRTVRISADYDSLVVRWNSVDRAGGPYYRLEMFEGKKQ